MYLFSDLFVYRSLRQLSFQMYLKKHKAAFIQKICLQRTDLPLPIYLAFVTLFSMTSMVIQQKNGFNIIVSRLYHFYHSFCLSVRLFVLFVCLSVSVSLFLFVCICSSVYLLVSLSVCVLVCLFVLFVCLSVYLFLCQFVCSFVCLLLYRVSWKDVPLSEIHSNKGT